MTYIDKAEAGTGFTMENFVLDKLHHQTVKVHRLRFVWWFWIILAFYGITVPFTAELAFIPMIGGLLLKFESQSSVMAIFAICLTICTWLFSTSLRWITYRP